ncbi:MAG: FapA family protein [Clostridiales bacterium]|nr:FapA family protein [Eubacteriales bacterium]MDH7565028.1 FapA family protein [Clostridiales bacterium]
MLKVSHRNSEGVNDGFFNLDFRQDGLYLTVYPPIGKGRKVRTEEVIEKLTCKMVKNFYKDIVELAVARADKNPVRIAEAQEEVKIDASASIAIAPDKMKAYITFTEPEGGKMLSAEEILNLLNNNGVLYGINKATLETISKYPVFNEMVCVAEGTPPVNGQNGKVEFHFNISKENKPKILEDGRVDFKELNLIESVKKGQVLCTLIPPIKGTNGRNVNGMDVPALDGKPALLPRGKNVEADENGQALIASIDGQVTYIDGKVNVYANYEVPADVDNSTGNIYFVGNVSIRGNVLSGFTVEAGGNIEVWGVVEGAVLKAEGDIILRRGMQGLGKGILLSGGDIVARYIEHSNVEAKNDIKSEAIMHSNVKCGNRLELGGKKGLLVGGTCKVGKEISAKVIGSHMATVTDIEVGVDPTLRERYKSLKGEAVKLEGDIKKAEQAVAILTKMEAAGALTPDKQEMLAKIVRTKVFLSNKLNEIRNEIPLLEAKLQQDDGGKVRVYNCIYPGTKVTIGTSMIFIKETLQYCTLYRDGADIRIGALDR